MYSSRLSAVLISILLVAAVSTAAQSDNTTGGFKCSGSTTKCTAMVDYYLSKTTTLSALQSKFSVTSFRSLLSVNPQFPVETTTSDHEVAANSTVKIPFPCACSDGYGISYQIPVYTVLQQDNLSYIAATVYAGITTYQQIGAVNNIQNLDEIFPGQKLHIPLPCSCDDVQREKVVHYGLFVQSGNTTSSISMEFGVSEDTIIQINGLLDPKQLQVGQLLDVPIPACTSLVNSTSLDYPLLLAKGTYSLTANDCILCKSNPAASRRVQCEASTLKPSNWTTCPSTQCSGGLYLGNTTSSTCHDSTCSYAGYTKDKILTTIDVKDTCTAKTPSKPKGPLHGNKKLPIILVPTLLILVLFLSTTCWLLQKKKRELKEQQEWLPDTFEHSNSSEVPIFRLNAIVAATKNFSASNKLGEGGFGEVYKGLLSSGQEVAVKRLAKNSGQGMQEFKNEVRLIAKLQHRNLVKTLGCCIRGEEKMLIYEYLPNSSLDKYIFNKEKRMLLDWRKRYVIILGIARGVLYLHQDSRLRIIHRDLKASNVLLDGTMYPKVSDFGLARMFGSDQIETNTGRVVGTYGYMAPEYAMNGLISVKSDVFSFGVLLLEIICGKRNTGFYDDQPSNLIGHVWQLWKDGKEMHIVDHYIAEFQSSSGGFHEGNNGNIDEILRCIQIGLLCVQDNANERPNMLEVVFMLSNHDAKLLPPKEPAFVIRDRASQYSMPKVGDQFMSGISEMTSTTVEAR